MKHKPDSKSSILIELLDKHGQPIASRDAFALWNNQLKYKDAEKVSQALSALVKQKRIGWIKNPAGGPVHKLYHPLSYKPATPWPAVTSKTQEIDLSSIPPPSRLNARPSPRKPLPASQDETQRALDIAGQLIVSVTKALMKGTL